MGKSSTPPPDYQPLADASNAAMEAQVGLGRDQLAFAREQYDRTAPVLENIANQQIQAQSEQMAQAQDYYDYQKETFRPLERGLVADAENFNTDTYRNQLAAQASADAGLAFGQTQASNRRAMAAMGVNPNSGNFAGMQNASNLALSANRANAMTNARMQADQMGYARKLDAVGMGRGLAGASSAAYGGATGAGSAAGNSAQSAGQNYMGNTAIGAGTMASGYGQGLSGLGNVLNNQTQTYINTNDGVLGDLGGALGGAASAYTAFSDRRLKENIKEVSVDQRTALSLYEFNYIGDDTRKFVGVMADEVELSYPDAVSTTDLGFLAVDYNALGIEFKEVSNGA